MIAIFHILFCFFTAGSLAEQPRTSQALPTSRCSLRCSSRDLAKRKADRDKCTFLAYADYCTYKPTFFTCTTSKTTGYEFLLLSKFYEITKTLSQLFRTTSITTSKTTSNTTMLPANKDARAINAFVDCPIPSPRDYFCRYGARAGGAGVLTTDERSEASISFSNTVIDSVVRGSQIFAETTEQQ